MGKNKEGNRGEKQRRRTLQWHPAFQAALQVELSEEREYLQFQEEYGLSRKPLQVDTLIIKVEAGHAVRKSIGRIFRRHNLVENKSPDDYISVNDFYKVLGYACIYQADTREVQEILPEELTLTLVCSHYPRGLVRHLRERYGAAVRREEKGIYYIEGVMFPLQVLLAPQLPKEEYLWLSRLCRGLGLKEDIEPLARAYRGKRKDPLYQAVMDLIIRANEERYEEGKKMCEALRELYADELAEKEGEAIERGMEQGMEQGMKQGVLLKLLSQVRKKRQKGLSAGEIAEVLEEDSELIQKLCQALSESPGSTDEELCRVLS